MIVASKREKASYYLYLIPAFACFGLFIFWPTIQSFYLSLCRYSLSDTKGAYIGLKNYTDLFGSKQFWEILEHTGVFTLFTVPCAIILGLLLAVLVHSKLIKYKTFYKVALYIPYVSSMVAVASVFRILFNANMSNSVVNQVLVKIGLSKVNWLGDPKWAMFVIILVSMWKSLGYIMIIYLGGLCGISDDVYEAADLDAVTPWKKLTKITVPLLKPTTFFLLATETISSFQVFTPVNIITEGGPFGSTTTLITYLYNEGFKGTKGMGKASAISVIIFAILTVLTIIQKKMTDED
ncbi:MAG: sugar ABC transporter permease [Oscillospiraceae bacterium]|nr:sugar ABC transporter permease [Oscillospiraceae bacterium]